MVYTEFVQSLQPKCTRWFGLVFAQFSVVSGAVLSFVRFFPNAPQKGSRFKVGGLGVRRLPNVVALCS